MTPCPYFAELLDEGYERFTDLDSIPATATVAGFDRTPVDVEPDPVGTISQSSLNSYVDSPRDYLFGRLLDSPDTDSFREGTLFHDFAEVYATHPDRIDDDAIARPET